MDLGVFSLLGGLLCAAVLWLWLRSLRWNRGDGTHEFEVPDAIFDPKVVVRRYRIPPETFPDFLPDGGRHPRPLAVAGAEIERLSAEVARLEDENRDLRAMLPTEDYRRIAERRSPEWPPWGPNGGKTRVG